MANKSWFKSRGYWHFSASLNFREDYIWVKRYVSSPTNVAKHPFFPLLHKKINQRRYKIVDYRLGRAIRNHSRVIPEGTKTESTKKVRPIHYAAHLDAQIYAYYAQELLQKGYESRLKKLPDFSECISAYRRIPTGIGKACKNNIHFAKDVFDYIKCQNNGSCALAFDIENFFSSLDHDILKKAWCKLLDKKSLPPDHYNIFKSVTQYRYIMLDDLRKRPGDRKSPFNEKRLAELRSKGINAFFESAADFRSQIKNGHLAIYKNQVLNENKKRKNIGIPQGLPISAILANIYLYEFDELIYNKVVLEYQGFYRRYSDDIVIVCRSNDYEILKIYIEETIQKFKLKISSSKTEICIFKPEKTCASSQERLVSYSFNRFTNCFQKGAPFRYLGFEFYGNFTRIKSSNLAKFYRRLKYSVKTRKKRMLHWEETMLETNAIPFKRKAFRMFTRMGYKAKWVRKWKTYWEYDPVIRKRIPIRKLTPKRYRGNVLTYAWRASEILNEPGIKRQFRRCNKILKKLLINSLQKRTIG